MFSSGSERCLCSATRRYEPVPAFMHMQIVPPHRVLHRRTQLTASIDNHMINGTKLLNVAGMTRGRRDGILKSEKLRHVVKIGPMHLKGVWCVLIYS